MKYRARPHEVDVFRFEGTARSVLEAQEWLSALDVSDCEVSSQGTREPYALDLTNEAGIRTLEEGEWLLHREGTVWAETNTQFGANYESL